MKYCKDCKKQITRQSKRCKSCSNRHRKGEYYLSEQAKFNIKEATKKAMARPKVRKQMIQNHADFNGKNNGRYIDGRCSKIYHCIDCNKEIRMETALYGQGRCDKCKYKDPERQHMYIDGRSFELYPKEFNDELKDQIKKRDNYTCQLCRIIEEEYLAIYGRVLGVHHIDYNKKNCVKTNLTTLCNQCNCRANYNRDYWKQYFERKINAYSLLH